MSVMSSAGESTKQAESCWSSSPAFISVGEFGMKESDSIPSRNRSAVASTCSRTPSGSSGTTVEYANLLTLCAVSVVSTSSVAVVPVPNTSAASSSRRGWSGFSWSGVTVTSTPCFSASKTASASATLRATRSNSPSGFSIGSPSAFFRR